MRERSEKFGLVEFYLWDNIHVQCLISQKKLIKKNHRNIKETEGLINEEVIWRQVLVLFSVCNLITTPTGVTKLPVYGPVPCSSSNYCITLCHSSFGLLPASLHIPPSTPFPSRPVLIHPARRHTLASVPTPLTCPPLPFMVSFSP